MIPAIGGAAECQCLGYRRQLTPIKAGQSRGQLEDFLQMRRPGDAARLRAPHRCLHPPLGEAQRSSRAVCKDRGSTRHASAANETNRETPASSPDAHRWPRQAPVPAALTACFQRLNRRQNDERGYACAGDDRRGRRRRTIVVAHRHAAGSGPIDRKKTTTIWKSRRASRSSGWT